RLRIEMAEGRKRIVRRMCEAVGHPVLRLERIALGPLELSDLRRGHTRTLRAEEVRRLRGSVGLEVPEPARRSRAGGEVRPAARTGRGKPVPRPRRPHRQGRR
ncbi:MAG: pseudouridine synthase, partial [bacterium]|nr:pseudouridine synthase [bacterium]